MNKIKIIYLLMLLLVMTDTLKINIETNSYSSTKYLNDISQQYANMITDSSDEEEQKHVATDMYWLKAYIYLQNYKKFHENTITQDEILEIYEKVTNQ